MGLLSDGELEAELERAGPRPGVPKVRMIAAKDDHGLTRSEAERRMRRLIREARLPQPLTNTRLAGYEVDFLWPDQRLIVEVDGYRFHGHRSAFERDRRKAMALIASGYTVIRVTWRQLTQEPHAVVAAIASALSAASRATEYRDSIS